MEITILGSGTAIPDGERGSPGIALRSDDTLLFLDLGSGTLYRGVRFGVDVSRVDGILFSHLHPDHTGDLVPLLFAFRNPEWPRQEALTIFGPPGLPEFFRGLEANYASWIAADGYHRELNVLRGGPTSLRDVQLRTCSVRHGLPAVAYEVTDARARRVVYSGDTEYSSELAVFARDADLLILECSFPEGEERPGHLTPTGAGRMAAEARCRRLLLTHFYPACRGQDLVTPCRKVYEGPVTLAEDGLTLQV